MQKERVRSSARVSVSGEIKAVGQGRPRKNTVKQFNDELITRVTVPEQLKNNEFATQIFKQTSSILIHRKLLKPSHIVQVMAYAKAVSVYFATIPELIEMNLVFLDALGNPKQNIAAIQHQAYQQLVKFGSLLGLDPLSELRTGLIKNQEKEDLDDRSDFSKFD
ncbi:MAG: hypothetical protein Q4E81_04220 [Succinatimonas sp.]|nr:hypothetical protein [Succinatimonas sp.]